MSSVLVGAGFLAAGASAAARDLDKIHSRVRRTGAGAGTVRIIYAPAAFPAGTLGNPAASCGAIEVEVDWAQAGGGGGTPGPTGAQGPTGPQGLTGPGGPTTRRCRRRSSTSPARSPIRSTPAASRSRTGGTATGWAGANGGDLAATNVTVVSVICTS